jgi:hypothetical protein
MTVRKSAPSPRAEEGYHFARRPRRQGGLFAGNRKLTGSGAGPALNIKDIDPSFIELVGTKVSDRPITLVLDQTKRSYLHPEEGSEAARVGAGLFTRKA